TGSDAHEAAPTRRPDHVRRALAGRGGVSGPLDGRVAVVTGAFGRLGPVWCAALLKAGARVVGLDLPDAAPSEEYERLRQESGERLATIPADVRDRASLDAARNRCVEVAGEPAVLVNNAGIDQPPNVTKTYTIEEVPVEQFHRVLDVNVTGAFQAAQVFGPGMVRAGRGSIINIASLYASVSPDARF